MRAPKLSSETHKRRNAQCSVQERQELRARQKAIEEAEAARRRRVTVTFDIMGRQASFLLIQCLSAL
jgi:hypothetical protein